MGNLFFRPVTEATDATRWQRGHNDANLRGTASDWNYAPLLTTRGGGVVTGTVTSITGTTLGLEPSLTPLVWISPPLDADVTISGTLTFNLRMAEAMAAANATAQCVIERVDSVGAIISTVVNSERGTEMGTTEAAQNWTASPTSTNFLRGDRIRISVAFNDATSLTMGSGFTLTFWYAGTTAAASGDSYVTFTETLSFVSAPAGSQVFPTDTTSDVATAAVDREAWTSRGAGVQTDVTNTVAGYTAPIQATDTAGGTVVDWWTRQLAAMTLGGAVLINLRQAGSSANIATSRCEIAICASDGTGCTTWGGTTNSVNVTASEAATVFYVSGDDTSVSVGQRLRIRLLIDDASVGPMSAAGTVTHSYAGTSGGASGDTFVTFTQTLTEGAAAERVPYFTPYPQLLAH